MKEDGKPCLTSVTIILFEKLETGHFCKRPENINVK